MEDHLCPRLVQPQAACLTCLARPQPLAKPHAPRCYNRMTTTTTTSSSTERASKRSPPSPAPTQPTPTPRPNHAPVQPATLPPTLPTSHRNTLQHLPRAHDLDKFAANITSTELPQPTASPLHPCEPFPVYTRLLKRYSSGASPLLRPINSWRDLPTTTTAKRTRR